MMQSNDLPFVSLPADLSDEAAAKLLEFLQELTAALESHYYGQLHRYYGARDHQQNDLPPQPPHADPPF